MPQSGFEPETITVGELDISMTIVLPDSHHREKDAGRTVEIVDYTSVGESLDNGEVYAYADAETGEFLGLLNAELLPEGIMTELERV